MIFTNFTILRLWEEILRDWEVIESWKEYPNVVSLSENEAVTSVNSTILWSLSLAQSDLKLKKTEIYENHGTIFLIVRVRVIWQIV